MKDKNGRNKDGPEEIPKCLFTEVIDELKEEVPKEQNYKFSEDKVDLVRAVFIWMMLWFAFLLLAWDVVVPIGAIKAMFWTQVSFCTYTWKCCRAELVVSNHFKFAVNDVFF